jgi:hypothetical protein
MPFYYSSLVISILLGVLGQLALKSGADRAATFIHQCTEPLSIIGLAIYLLAAGTYTKSLRG